MRATRRFTLGSLLLTAAVVMPLAAPAAERGADGAVVVFATQGGDRGVGAGTIVGRDGSHVRVLTANHVATHGVLEVAIGDGERRPAHIVASIVERDLAVLETDVPADEAERLHVAPIAEPRDREPVHVWGSGNDGPAYEPGTLARVDAELPDGAPNGRYALGCPLCHQGDSGAGVFDVRGRLVGVYVGFFTVDAGRVHVAERPTSAAILALARSAGTPQPDAQPVALLATR